MVFPRDALLLVGHGSSRYPDAGRWLHEHATALRESGAFAETAVGLLRGSPSIAEGLASLTAPVVRIVPFFMEDGYFTRSAVPAALALAGRPNGGSMWYCPPVGLHSGLAALITAKIEACCPDPASWAILLVGHGSSRTPGRSVALNRHRASLTSDGQFAYVETAFLEESPFVPDALARMRHWKTAVVGVFAGDGGHPRDDLPGFIAAEQARRGPAGPLVVAVDTFSDDPRMQSMILDQAARGTCRQQSVG